MPVTIQQIASVTDGFVTGDDKVLLHGLAPADCAKAGDLTFAGSEDYFAAANRSEATAILASGHVAASAKTVIQVKDARVAMARVMPLFIDVEDFPAGVDPTATIADSAEIDSTAHIGPGCCVKPGVRIGARAVLMAGNYIGTGCQLGDDVCLHANVVLYAKSEIGKRVTIHAGAVIGSDGYGYALDEGQHRRVPHVGKVIVQDDVEIGANCAIDRASMGATVIGQGTKIDNLVHIAHNVVIGKHCLIMGQVGFAGSTRIGDYGVVASQAGISGHLTLGQQVTIGAKSGVMRDVADQERVLGIPAAPDKQAKRQLIGIKRLPDLIRRLRVLEAKVERLDGKGGVGDQAP